MSHSPCDSFDGDLKEKHSRNVEHIDDVSQPEDTKFKKKPVISDDVYQFGAMTEDELESRRKKLVRIIDLRCAHCFFFPPLLWCSGDSLADHVHSSHRSLRQTYATRASRFSSGGASPRAVELGLGVTGLTDRSSAHSPCTAR
jgi:hypothetical protein